MRLEYEPGTRFGAKREHRKILPESHGRDLVLSDLHPVALIAPSAAAAVPVFPIPFPAIAAAPWS